MQRFSTYHLWTSSISITWELVRNVNSQAPPRPTELETLGKGLAICVFVKTHVRAHTHTHTHTHKHIQNLLVVKLFLQDDSDAC